MHHSDSLPPLQPVIVHNASHVCALFNALSHQHETRPVELWSPPDAVRWQGPRWLWFICCQQAKTFPSSDWTYVLDCGDAVGMALTALDDGVPGVAVIGAPLNALHELQATAKARGARVLGQRPPRLDLGKSSDPLAACHAFLNNDQDFLKSALC